MACVHHWNIDRNNFGVCVKCGEHRDFAELQKDSRQLGMSTHAARVKGGYAAQAERKKRR